MFFFKPLASLIANWQQQQKRGCGRWRGGNKAAGCPNERDYLKVAQPKEVAQRVQLVWFRAGHRCDEDGTGEGGKGEGEEGGAKAPPAPPAEEDLTAEEAKEENITDMQIAFECLDVARVIYTRDKEAG